MEHRVLGLLSGVSRGPILSLRWSNWEHPRRLRVRPRSPGGSHQKLYDRRPALAHTLPLAIIRTLAAPSMPALKDTTLPPSVGIASSEGVRGTRSNPPRVWPGDRRRVGGRSWVERIVR